MIGSGVDNTSVEPAELGATAIRGTPENLQDNNICCGFYRTVVHSSDRRQYCGSLLRSGSSFVNNYRGCTHYRVLRAPDPLMTIQLLLPHQINFHILLCCFSLNPCVFPLMFWTSVAGTWSVRVVSSSYADNDYFRHMWALSTSFISPSWLTSAIN